jgi:hypothetical protein
MSSVLYKLIYINEFMLYVLKLKRFDTPRAIGLLLGPLSPRVFKPELRVRLRVAVHLGAGTGVVLLELAVQGGLAVGHNILLIVSDLL